MLGESVRLGENPTSQSLRRGQVNGAIRLRRAAPKRSGGGSWRALDSALPRN